MKLRERWRTRRERHYPWLKGVPWHKRVLHYLGWWP